MAMSGKVMVLLGTLGEKSEVHFDLLVVVGCSVKVKKISDGSEKSESLIVPVE